MVLLFHHALGLTPGCLAFADELRAAGHTVYAPDLYDGNTFSDLSDGVGYVNQIGFETIVERARVAAEALPNELVYAGFSLGVVPAQKLAQTRPGAKGAVLCHSFVPPSMFGVPWPSGLPAQIHMMEADEWVVRDGDLEAAREFTESVEGVELFLYQGERHLFADRGLPDYDGAAADLLKERVLGFLTTIDP